ncbi:MAG TPA: hypothetical protein VIM12_03105 [Noviherbaspirillum sp.]|uniref:hypothetical protein n=1 Tax=Noviherbaspirillum sp. TaxID=1926288 RepID=UPI002F95E526
MKDVRAALHARIFSARVEDNMETCTIESSIQAVIVSWNGSSYVASNVSGDWVDADASYEALHARLARRGFEAEDCHTLEAVRNLVWHPRTYRTVHPSDLRR